MGFYLNVLGANGEGHTANTLSWVDTGVIQVTKRITELEKLLIECEMKQSPTGHYIKRMTNAANVIKSTLEINYALLERLKGL